MAVDVHSTYITTNQQQHKCTSYQYSPSSLHKKLDYTNLLVANMVQKGAITEEIKLGKDDKYHIILHNSLHWVVDSRANSEFFIFVTYLTVVCTFLHHLHQGNLA